MYSVLYSHLVLVPRLAVLYKLAYVFMASSLLSMCKTARTGSFQVHGLWSRQLVLQTLPFCQTCVPMTWPLVHCSGMLKSAISICSLKALALCSCLRGPDISCAILHFQLLEEVVVDQICFNSGCISKLMLCNTDPLLTLIAGVKSTPTPHP